MKILTNLLTIFLKFNSLLSFFDDVISFFASDEPVTSGLVGTEKKEENRPGDTATAEQVEYRRPASIYAVHAQDASDRQSYDVANT